MAVQSLPPAEESHLSFDTFRDFEAAISGAHFAWRMDPGDIGAEFSARIRQRLFDRVHFTDISCDPCSGARTPREIQGASDAYVCLSLVVDGGQRFAHGDVESELEAGDLLLWDAARPGEFECREPMRLLTMLFPQDLVAQHTADIGDLCARKISGAAPTGMLLSSHVRTLHATIDRLTAEERPPVLRSTLDLLAACFRPQDLILARTGYQRALLRRVQQYMLERLGDPELRPQEVAEAFRFSPRYLHRLFSEGGATFSSWLRRERLARALRALSSPAFDGETITQVAYRVGFSDAAHFSRAFREQYGKSPQQHREGRRGRVGPD